MLSPGTRIDRFVVAGRLGQGGMATVYAAQHSLLGSWHALKVINGADISTQDRLLREGRVQARLDPGLIVPVTDVIQVHGAPALVMPLVRGQSLDALLAAGPVPHDEAWAVFGRVCRCVAHAHHHGVVHRDLKPGNIMVDPGPSGPRLRVADFGLVRAVSSSEGAPLGEVGVRTRRGAMMGSPAYAAPEQLVDAAGVERSADVWSLGVLLYELLSGRRPFDGRDLRELVQRVCAGDPDLSPLPESARSLVGRLLAVEPRARPPSASEVLDQLPPQAHAPVPIEGELLRRLSIPEMPALQAAAPSVGGTLAPPTAGPVRDDVSHALPAERDAYVGRRSEAAQLLHGLERSRLVTITGPGGTGKTRFMVHFGWAHQGEWPGGLQFCDLTEARSVADIARALAASLDVPLDGSDPVVRLGHVLAERGECVVLLDNFEQIVEHARATVGRWLDLAPGARFVVTSRAPLALRGERLLALDTLPLEEATALFLARARAARPDLDPTDEERGQIVELVELLDRLPLALELAAARIRTLSPGRMLARMDDRFRLLTTRGRNDRRATLRATLDWSWDLLGAEERQALAQLSVFEGGFDLEAAEAIVEVAGDDWVLDLVESLVDKSLVRNLSSERFGLLVSVQEYASEKLDELAQRGGAEERHAAWYAALGSSDALRSHSLNGGIAARARTRAELDNLLAAHRRTSDGSVRAAVALAAWSVFILQGPLQAGREVLTSSLETQGVPPERRVDLLRMVAAADERLGRPRDAERWAHQALSEAAALGDARREAETRMLLGNIYRATGQLDEAKLHSETARAICRRLGARQPEGVATGNLAVVVQALGHMEEAERLYREAERISHGVGDRRQVGMVYTNLGVLAGQRGRLAEAQGLFEKAYAIAERAGAGRSQSFCLLNLGLVYSHRGEHEGAMERFEEALRLARTTGDRRLQAACLGYLGGIYRDVGQRALAASTASQFLVLAEELQDVRRAGMAHGLLGHLKRLAGDFEGAAEHLNRALQAHIEVRSVNLVPRWRAELARLALLRQDLAECHRLLTQAREEAKAYPPVLAEVEVLVVRAHLAQGELDAAASGLTQLEPPSGRAGAMYRCAQAELRLAQGDVQGAQHALDEIDPSWARDGTELGDRIAGLRGRCAG